MHRHSNTMDWHSVSLQIYLITYSETWAVKVNILNSFFSSLLSGLPFSIFRLQHSKANLFGNIFFPIFFVPLQHLTIISKMLTYEYEQSTCDKETNTFRQWTKKLCMSSIGRYSTCEQTNVCRYVCSSKFIHVFSSRIIIAAK